MREVVSDHFGHQADDIWGMFLTLVGVLSGLGIYFNLMGVAGHGLREVAGLTLGVGRFVLPLAFVAVGVALMRDEEHNEPVRFAIGAFMVTLAVTAFGHLWNGSPVMHAPRPILSAAGGYVGVIVAGGLKTFIGAWGANVLFAFLFVMGVLVLVQMSVRSAAQIFTGYTSDLMRSSAERLRERSNEVRQSRETQKALPAASGDGKVIDLNTGEILSGQEAEPPEFEDDEEFDDFEDEDIEAYDDEVYDDEPEYEDEPEDEDVIDLHAEPESPKAKVPEGEAHQPTMDLGPVANPVDWKKPDIKLLKRSQSQSVDRRAIEIAGKTLEAALASHGVGTKLVGMTVGPSITRYELELGAGVKVARVTSLNKDIAYAMASADVRILAPIPGRSAIGIEVPNVSRALVTLGDILTSAEAHQATHPLEVALGRDIAGRAVLVNLATMPHVLIAGATGAGKSSCINSIITSVLMRNTPEQVRMILVDPKRVELGQYNGLPHLLTQVVTNPKKAANALQWAVAEMEKRYDLLAEIGVRDITGYNSAYDRGDLKPEPGSDKRYERLPFIMVVVDELNDLMMVAARDVEASITRIAQMARAVGIHLIIATQRPSVDVITGVIKANIPSRMAFAVSSLADSRVILDQPGAERLIGQGDMLLLSASSSVARRIQGSWVTEDEVRKVVAAWRRQGGSNYIEGVEGSADSGGNSGSSFDGEGDELLDQATELVVRSKMGSTSMLQRKLRVGFARAGRLMDLLEERGVVGPAEGSKARTVLMTIEEFEQMHASQ
jgi:DNA segregation ATPase FtsK/SpoIIIE, S-DNA-T family